VNLPHFNPTLVPDNKTMHTGLRFCFIDLDIVPDDTSLQPFLHTMDPASFEHNAEFDFTRSNLSVVSDGSERPNGTVLNYAIISKDDRTENRAINYAGSRTKHNSSGYCGACIHRAIESGFKMFENETIRFPVNPLAFRYLSTSR